MLSAPSFWWRDDPTAAARALAPAGSLYGAVAARCLRRGGVRLDVPVLCVGNFVVGGAGKTPLVLEILGRLIEQGHRPAVLSRGYGRERGRSSVVRVDPTRHAAVEVGDEPLLLAAVAPTYVSSDRVAAGAAAIREGASIVVLDDGLQNRALVKDVTIAVVDAVAGVGNGLCIPAGPLRAPLEDQWPLASALCVVGDGVRGTDLARQAIQRQLPVIAGSLDPDPDVVTALAGKRLLAFAGIGRPQKFFQTLERAGLHPVERRSFPDHHRFSSTECAGLVAEAARLGADLVTTAKDRVRLPVELECAVFPVRMTFAASSPVDALLHALRPR